MESIPYIVYACFVLHNFCELLNTQINEELVQASICFSRPSAPGPIKFLSAAFDFLPVCVVKCSCAALVKYNFEFSVHKY